MTVLLYKFNGFGIVCNLAKYRLNVVHFKLFIKMIRLYLINERSEICFNCFIDCFMPLFGDQNVLPN